MNLRLCFLLLSLFVCMNGVVASNGDIDRLFVESQTAFEQADAIPAADKVTKTAAFRRVAALYQRIIDQGVRSGVVYYNLGNALVQAEEPGQAVAAYLTAKRYLPLDPYVEANLRSVVGSEATLPTPMIEHVFFWQNWVGYPQKFYVATILCVLTVLSGAALLFWPQRRTRRITLILLVVAAIASLSAVYDWYRFEYLQYAVVAVDPATPRKGNSLQYEPAFTKPLPLGSLGVVIDQRGGWLLLRFDAAQEGWLPKDQVAVF